MSHWGVIYWWPWWVNNTHVAYIIKKYIIWEVSSIIVRISIETLLSMTNLDYKTSKASLSVARVVYVHNKRGNVPYVLDHNNAYWIQIQIIYLPKCQLFFRDRIHYPAHCWLTWWRHQITTLIIHLIYNFYYIHGLIRYYKIWDG